MSGRCLDDIAQTAQIVDAATSCDAVEGVFRRRPEINSVVVSHPDGGLEMLTRTRFTREITGPLGYGRTLYGRRPVSDLPGAGRSLVLAGSTPLLDGGEAVLQRRGGDRYDDVIVPRGDGVATVSVADLFAELAELHAHRSLHDPLTGLANRELFLQRVRTVLVRPDVTCAVLFVDIDDFKAVNDSLGHPAGDELLRHVGRRLSDAFRDEDTVARFGGDEFAVLLNSADPRSAGAAADRIALALSAPAWIKGRSVTVRASVGVALEAGHRNAEELLRDADLAMYATKNSGKDGHAIFEPAMHSEAIGRLELAQDLSVAVAQDQFRLEYQPIVNLETRVVAGVEALLRWDHPVRGGVAPLEFIPVAEQSGDIIAIGRWVLHEALGQMAAWRRGLAAATSMVISVNVSPRQLASADFEADVRSALDRSGVAPTELMLEITETALIEDGETTRAQLIALSDLGVRIAIDDFGAGFSSLHRLQQLPVSVLKIDKTFVDELATHDCSGLVRGVLSLADALGLESLAEGIESEHQLDELAAAGCAMGQGYLVSRPLRPDAVASLLEEQAPLSVFSTPA